MKRNVLMSLAYEVIYLEKEAKEHTEGCPEWKSYYDKGKEARHIMVMLFGSAITTRTIVEVRVECRELSAFEMWEKYISQ